jgi:hypothetical protein
MSGLSVDFRVQSENVEERLQRMETGFSASAWAAFLFGVVGPYLQQRAEQRFQTQGDEAVGGKWLPHHPATAHFRTSQGFPEGPINHRTGELERYITGGQGAAIPVGPTALLTFPDPSIGLGEDLYEKLRTAQKGKPKPKTPPRPVLGLGGQDAIFVVASMAFYAQKVVDGMGP